MLAIALTLAVIPNAGAQDAHSDDRQELLELMRVIEAAINNKDMASVRPHLTADSVVTFQDTTVVRGPAEIEAYFNRMLSGGASVLKGISVTAEVGAPATFISDDIATAYGHTVDRFEFRTGNTMDLRTAWSSVVFRENGQWYLASVHFSNNLFDNPLLNGARRMVWIAGVIGLVAGLVLMAIAWRIRGGRP